MPSLGAALVAIAVSSGGALADGPLACEREMTRAAAAHGVPLNVLYSVGLTETGSRVSVRVPISVDARLLDYERVERLADRRHAIGNRVSRSFD